MKKVTFKTKLINFLDRRKHSATENLRLSALIPLIMLFIGLFQPLISVSTGFYVSDARGETTTTTPIWQPTENVLEVSIGDFVFHKSLREFEIFGLKIGDMKFLGANLYDLVTTPLPSFEGLNEVSSFLDSGALAFLVDENFVNFCKTNLGDFGNSVVEFGKVLNDIAGQAGEVIRNVSTALNNINAASVQIRSTISQVESYLNAVDWVFIIVNLILLVTIILFACNKGPKALPKVIFTLFTVGMIVVGIAAIVCNNIIADSLSSGMQDLGASLTSLLNDIAPGVMDFLISIFGIDDISFVIKLVIFCGAGWWLTTIALFALTALSYLTPSLEKKRLLAQKDTKKEVKKIEDKKEAAPTK